MFWGNQKWAKYPNKGFPVEPRNNLQIDEAGYRLSIGKEVCLPDKNGSNVRKLEIEETFSIGPGQFAYILTEELVRMPLDAIGFISVRASTKFFGLVNVSGFHVDPGYVGKLVFAVFNSGPSRITFKRGQEIFSLWIADLDGPIPSSMANKKGYDTLEPELLNKISGNHLTAYQLSEKIAEIETLANGNKNEMHTFKVYSSIIAIVLAVILGPLLASGLGTYWEMINRGFFQTNGEVPDSDHESGTSNL